MKVSCAAAFALLAAFPSISVGSSPFPAISGINLTSDPRRIEVSDLQYCTFFEGGIDKIIRWKEHPENADYLVSEDGRSILQVLRIREFILQGCNLLCLFNAGILPHLRGWEDLVFDDFEQVLKKENFDINEFPWWEMDVKVLAEVMEKSIEPIEINQDNDKYLTDELVNLAVNGSLSFEVGDERSAKKRYRKDDGEEGIPAPRKSRRMEDKDGPDSSVKKSELMTHGNSRLKKTRPLWMAFKVGPILNFRELSNYFTLFTNLYDFHMVNMDVNTRVFFQFRHNLLSKEEARSLKGTFDISEIPWYFFTERELCEFLELVKQPIFINAENDFYLTLEFIYLASESESIWKHLRPDGAALDIPNYIKLMEVVAIDIIANDNYINAVIWSVLTGSFYLESEIIDDARQRLSKIVHPRCPSYVTSFRLNDEMGALEAGHLDTKSPLLLNLFTPLDYIAHRKFANENFYILIEHFPLPFLILFQKILVRMPNLDFDSIFNRGGSTYSRRMAKSFFTYLIHSTVNYSRHANFIKIMIERFPQGLIEIVPAGVKVLELNPSFVAEVLVDDPSVANVIRELINRDPSIENMEACFESSDLIKRLYKQICIKEGKPSFIEFIQTFKGIIPDHQFKRIVAGVWAFVVSKQSSVPRTRIFTFLRFFFFNNLLSIGELFEICHYRWKMDLKSLFSYALALAKKFQPSDLDAVVYWNLMDRFKANDISIFQEFSERKFLLQFFSDQNRRIVTLTDSQVELLNLLGKLEVSSEESITIPSIYSSMYRKLDKDEFYEEALNSMKNIMFVLEFGNGEFIKVDGEIAAFANFFRGQLRFKPSHGGGKNEKKAYDAAVRVIPIPLDPNIYKDSKYFVYVSNILKKIAGHEVDPAVFVLSKRSTDELKELIYFIELMGINLPPN